MTKTSTNPRAIDGLRDEIDRLDQELLALMERRLDLAAAIAGAKAADTADGPGDGTENELLLRPAREAQVIARLSDMTRRIPGESIAAIWRELMAVNLQTQRKIEIALSATRHPARIQLMARARFGTVLPITQTTSPQAALAKARAGDAIALVEIDDSGWWTQLAEDPELTIIDGLLGEGGRGSALAIGRLSEARLSEERRFAVLADRELAARLGRGEVVCPLAHSGEWYLCAIERVVPLARRAA